MGYTPNTWSTGDKITAVKMNGIEQGLVRATTIHIPFTISEVNGELVATTNASFSTAINAVNNEIPVVADIDLFGEFIIYAPGTGALVSDGTIYGLTFSTTLATEEAPTFAQITWTLSGIDFRLEDVQVVV